MPVERLVSDALVLRAPPDAIFDILADPTRHERIDGSGTLRGRLRDLAVAGRGGRESAESAETAERVESGETIESGGTLESAQTAESA